jgi:hypothetical protein
MSNNHPRRDDTGIPKIDWRGTLWAMLFVFLISYVFIALFPGMHPILRIVLVLALYFGARYAYYRFVKKRR